MKVLLSWLNELAPLGDDAEALAEVMDDLGLAVEARDRVGEPVAGVVVAEVLALRPHPDADKIQLVDVDAGDGEESQICCGAFNMAVGDRVPLATVGTVMPDGRLIERRKLRGQWSNGMLCSAAELGLSGDHAGILVLPAGVALGAPVFEALGVRPDVVFDLDLTRNRPDAWSHLGVARDLAARSGVALAAPTGGSVDIDGASEGVAIDLVDGEGCGRFTLHVVTGVEVGSSPGRIAERLLRAGMRPINNVVDASNYVMLELGHPNHAYDLDKLGGGRLRVRGARSAETIVTLDGIERRLAEGDVVICDGGDVPIGIGGVMGGSSTEVDEGTTAVAFEAAWFDPPRIAATAARLGLRSEASARFERGVDPADVELVARRFVEVLRHSSPRARLHGIVDALGVLPARRPVRLRTARVNALLGVELDDATIAGLLDPIGFTTAASGEPGVHLVTLPTWRYDATAEVDVIEEVARHHGYGRIQRTVPRSSHPGGLTDLQRLRRHVRQVLLGLGVTEAMPNPFLAPGDLERAGLPAESVAITNPLDADESVLRTSLLPGLLKAIAYNGSHRRSGARLFENGHVVGVGDRAAALPDERELLAVALAGAEAPSAVAVLDELVASIGVADVSLVAGEPAGMHPTRSALVCVSGAVVGEVGEVDPDVAGAYGVAERVAWLSLELAAFAGEADRTRRYRRVSRFPSSDVDLAFVVADPVPAALVEATIRSAAGEVLVALGLFDVFRGGSVPTGSRSLAYALRFQAPDRTLTDADIADARARIVAAMADRHGAMLRT